MWTIIPDTQGNYDDLNPIRLGYTYLHGKLQADCGYDCYGFINCETFIQQLKLSKIPDECGVEVEMEDYKEFCGRDKNGELLYDIVFKTKLTNGKVTITKIIL